jgi:thiol-disulfide isomerase/thioredoxin
MEPAEGPQAPEALDRSGESRIPRPIAAVLIGAIVIAAVIAAVRPAFLSPVSASVAAAGPSRVGVITQDLAAPSAAGRVGAPAPDFSWVTPAGPTTRLAALHGGPVVVNFWATWCVPCRTEMPLLEAVANTTDASFLEVDLEEDAPAVRAFFDQLQLTRLSPVVDTDGAVFRRWGVVSLPTTFFVDRDGIVRTVEIGPLTEERVRAGLAGLTAP